MKVIFEEITDNMVFGKILFGYEEEDQHWVYFNLKWDGCLNYWHARNEPYGKDFGLYDRQSGIDEYIHICDIDDMISQLIMIKQESLKAMNREKFG